MCLKSARHTALPDISAANFGQQEKLPYVPPWQTRSRNPSYMTGFGNEFATEARKGALPVGQNSPQKCPEGLYAEQISGTSFTAPRHDNRRTCANSLLIL